LSKITDQTPMQDALESSSGQAWPFVSVILTVYNDAKAVYDFETSDILFYVDNINMRSS
jgi:hypothetical protein